MRLISQEKVSEASSGEFNGVRFPTSQSVGNLSTRKKNKVKSMRIGNIEISIEERREDFPQYYNLRFALVLGDWIVMEEFAHFHAENVAEIAFNCENNDIEELYKLPIVKKMVLVENTINHADYVCKKFSEALPVEEKRIYKEEKVAEDYEFSFREVVFFGYWKDVELPYKKSYDYKLITYELIRIALEIWEANRSY